MLIPYTWHHVAPQEQDARKDFFTLMEWVRLRQYQPPRHEWRLIQQVFDEVFQRSADVGAMCGFALGLPFTKKVERDFLTGRTWVRTPWQRAKIPLFTTLLGHEIGMRLLLTYPAEEFWQVVTRLDSDLGNAARQIKVLEEKPSVDKLQYDRHRYTSNIAGFPYQVLTDNAMIINTLSFISIFTLRDTFGSLMGGTALLDRRMVGPGMNGPDPEARKRKQENGEVADEQPSTLSRMVDSLRGKAEDQPESGTSVTDVVKLSVTTRFFRWTPFVWTHISSPITKVNSVSIGVPISAGASHTAQWTLKSKDLLLNNTQYGARLWWTAHLSILEVLTKNAKTMEGPPSQDGQPGGGKKKK